MIDADELKADLSATEYRRIFQACGFDLQGERGTDLDGILGPTALGEGESGNFSVDLENGLVKDWGSSGYRGDVIDVVQDTQRLDFQGALQWIADEVGASPLAPGGDGRPDPPPEPSLPGAPKMEEDPEPAASRDQVHTWHERLMSDGEAPRAARRYLKGRAVPEGAMKGAHVGLAHTPRDRRATWWIMIPVARRDLKGAPVVAVKGFAFDPSAGDWKRGDKGRKIARNGGSAALWDLADPQRGVDSPLVVCEGELDALSAYAQGFHAATGTAGAGTFKPEWARYLASLAPAQEHGVVVAFDGDESGRKGAQSAAEDLHAAGADVRIASLPDGTDVNDVLTEGDKMDLHAYLGQADPYEPPEELAVDGAPGDEEKEEYEPFPLDALPGPIRAYVRASTRALGEEVPPAMVAVPTLSVLAGAVGSSAKLRLKRSWTEPATLWTVLVAPSGSTKSPAFDHALRPTYMREAEARDAYEKELAEWNAQEEPDEREKPTRERFRTGDATPEAVVKILEETPRGILLARDEIGAWIGSFDRYVNGAADLQFWIEVWGGIQASRDRAGEGNTTVSDPVVPVSGTIQPGTLKEKLDEIHFDTGFASRLILCEPPSRPKRWTEADVTPEVRDQYERLLASLYGAPSGREVPLSPEAKRLWIDYYNGANAALEDRPEGPLRALAAKGITHTARLALVLHLCRKASGEADSSEVDAPSMEAALQVGQWLTDETLRVYRRHNLGAKAKPPIRRFLEKLPERFETSDALEIAEVDELAESTMFKWLNDLQGSNDVEKLQRGHYRKT